MHVLTCQQLQHPVYCLYPASDMVAHSTALSIFARPRVRACVRSPAVSNTTVVVAPAFSPFGFSPFGGFGYGFGMPMFMPFGGFSSIFGFMFLALMVSVVFNVIKGIMSSSSGDAKKKDDTWGDL